MLLCGCGMVPHSFEAQERAKAAESLLLTLLLTSNMLSTFHIFSCNPHHILRKTNKHQPSLGSFLDRETEAVRCQYLRAPSQHDADVRSRS